MATLAKKGGFGGLVTDQNYRAWASVVIVLGMMMAIIDSSIVNVAIPHIMAAFGSNLEDIEWVSTGYMLTMAVMMPTTGWLGDVFGRKRLYATCLVIFTITSVLCGMAWSTGSLVAFRVLQGIGGGAIQPVGQAILYSMFPPNERGKAMAMVGMGAMMGPVIGPTLGGWLVETVGWRSIFYVNLPVGILAVIMALGILRESEKHTTKFDVWGFSLMALFLTTVLLAVSQGNSKGWDSPYIVAMFIAAALSFLAFLVVETFVEHPVADLSLFLNPVFAAGNVISVIMGIALFGGVFLLPVFVQNLMGYDAIQTGLLLAPSGLVVGFIMPISGKLTQKIHPALQIGLGMVIMAYGLYLQAFMTIDTSIATITWWGVLRGIGMGLAFPPMNQVALGAVPLRKLGQASGLYNLTRQLGGTFGIAGLSTLLTQRQVFHTAVLGQQMHRNLAMGAMHGMQGYFLHHGSNPLLAQQQAMSLFGAMAMRQASVWAFQDAFKVAAFCGFATLLFVWLMKPAPGSQAASASHAVVME